MSVLTVPIVPTGINTMSELARDPRPVSSFSDTFFLLANQSKDPDLREAIKLETIKMIKFGLGSGHGMEISIHFLSFLL